MSVSLGGETFTNGNFHSYCDELAAAHRVFQQIITAHGYPPFWSREPNFESLVHIILEQQVSLASALAAFKKLKQTLHEITPASFLQLTDDDLKSCYFSRQKIIYTRHLAACIIDGGIELRKIHTLDNATISSTLQQVKGIGEWTANIFLMMALHRMDIFPINDIALVSSMKDQLALEKNTSKEELLAFTVQWKPYRTIAAYLLWHAYLSKRKK